MSDTSHHLSAAVSTQSGTRAALNVGAAHASAVICSTLASLILARTLAIGEFGRVAYGLNGYLVITLVAGFGLTTGVVAAAARAQGQARGAETSRSAWPAVGSLFALRVLSVVPILLSGVAAAWITRDSLVLLAAVVAAISLIQDFIAGVLQGLFRTGTLAITIAAQPVFYLALLLATRPEGAETVLLLNALAFIFALLIAAGGVLQAGFPLSALRSFRRAAIRPVIAVSGQSYLATFLQVGFVSVPPVVLGAASRFEAAAGISIVLSLIRLLPGIASPVLAAVYFPRTQATNADGVSGPERLLRSYGIALTALGLAAAAALALLAGPVLRVLYAGRYDALGPFVVGGAVLVPLLMIEMLLTWTLLGRGHGGAAVAALAVRFLVGAGACVLVIVLPRSPIGAPEGAYQDLSPVVAAYVLAAALGVALQLVALSRAARHLLRAGAPAAVLAAALAAALVAVVSPGGSSPAAAQVPACLVVDARRGFFEVVCAPGFATPRDRVLVYGRVTPPTAVPAEWRPEMMDETWVIDAGTRGRASMVITFRRDGGDVLAELYHDSDGDGGVTYRLQNGVPQITEAFGHWALQFRARGGWWQRPDKLNFNLDVAVDGAVRGTIDYPQYAPYLRTDGSPDLIVRVRDSAGSGRPSHEWRQAYPPLPDDAGYYRTSIMVNTLGDESPLDRGPLPWPFLGDDRVGFIKPYFRSPPPIHVDWARGRVVALGEFVASRGKAGNYFVYSIARAAATGTTATNFENPFAFYNLAGNPADYPDLAIRVAHFGAHDPYMRLPIPTQQVDFSWRNAGLVASDGPVWDYKVSVAGRHPIESVVPIEDFAINVVPYDRLPEWVRDGQWDFATLVAREGPGYPSSEGLYEWYPLEGADPQARNYLAGMSANPPEQAFDDIVPGHRGERTFALGGVVTLYLSPVDRKLHLRGATEGVWRLDDQRRLRYWDRDRNGEVEEWELTAPDEPPRRLRLIGNLALYTEGQDAEIRVLEPRALAVPFESPLPATPEQWAAFRSVHSAPPADWAPGDVRAMLAHLPPQSGSAAVLSGVTIEQSRRTLEGARFVLRVGHTLGQDWAAGALAPLNGLAPGVYECVYSDAAGLHVRTLTPATLTVEVRLAANSSQHLSALEPLPISIKILNRGGEDVRGDTLRLLASGPATTGDLIAAASVEVLGGGELLIETQWAPPRQGEWTLRGEITSPPNIGAAGAAVVRNDLALTVAEARGAGEPPDGPARTLAAAAPLIALATGIVLGNVLLGVTAAHTGAVQRGRRRQAGVE